MMIWRMALNAMLKRWVSLALLCYLPTFAVKGEDHERYYDKITAASYRLRNGNALRWHGPLHLPLV